MGSTPKDIAIISNAFTPYRTALHLRIAREMPQIRLHSIFTHDISNAPWSDKAPAEINAVAFGKGESSEKQDDPRRALAEWRKGGRILNYIKQHDVRAVVLLGYNDPGRLRIVRACHRQGIPLFLFGDSNIKGDLASGLKGRIKRYLVSSVVRKCTGVMSCGTLGRAYFEKYGASPERVFYFPYEPDYQLIQSLGQDVIQATMAQFGLNGNRRRIVFSGRMVDVKRPDLLIDAFIQIAHDRPEWDLVMVGEGPLRESLQARIPAGLEKRVTWTGFLSDQKTLSAIYRASDVLVLPSSYEPWALVINEAAAAGLAIVSSDVVGAAADLVRDEVNGFVFPSGDLAALRDKLLRVTDKNAIGSLRAGSAVMLEEWRKKADPVAGLGKALQFAGIL